MGLLDPVERANLITLLERLPNIEDPQTRRQLVSGLPSAVRNNIPNSITIITHLTAIVDTADDHLLAPPGPGDAPSPILQVIDNAILLISGTRLAKELQDLRDRLITRADTHALIQARGEPTAESLRIDLPFEQQLTVERMKKRQLLRQKSSFQLFEHLVFSVDLPLTTESILAIVRCFFESVLWAQINEYLEEFVELRWLEPESGDRYRLALPDLSDRWHSRAEHMNLYRRDVVPSIERWRDKQNSIADYPEDLLLILAHQRHSRYIEPFNQTQQTWPLYWKWRELAIRFYQCDRSELFARLAVYRCSNAPAPQTIECALLRYLADRIQNQDQQYKANHRYLWVLYISDEPAVQEEYRTLRKWLLDRNHDEPIAGLLQAALRASDTQTEIEPLVKALLMAPSEVRLFALRYILGPVFRNHASQLQMVVDRLQPDLKSDDLLALGCGLTVTFREQRSHWALDRAMAWLDDLHGGGMAIKPLFMALLPVLPGDKRTQYAASILANEIDKLPPTLTARPAPASFTPSEIDALVEEIVIARSAGRLASQQVRWHGNRHEYAAIIAFACDALEASGARGALLEVWDRLNAAVSVYPNHDNLRLAGLAAYLRCCRLLDLDRTLPRDIRDEVLAVGDVFQNTKDQRVIVTLIDIFLEGQRSAQRVGVVLGNLITTNPDLAANEWLLDALAEQPSIRGDCYQAHKGALDSDQVLSAYGNWIAEHLEELLEEPLAELRQKYENEGRRPAEITELCRDWAEGAQNQIHKILYGPMP